MVTRALIAATSIVFSVVGFSVATAAVPDYIAKAVADPSRPADDRKLDADRKPWNGKPLGQRTRDDG